MSDRRDAKRYRLLRDYLLTNGFVVHEQTAVGEQAFVMNAEFYGPTFESAVDSLEQLATSPRMKQRPTLTVMPNANRSNAREGNAEE